MNIMREPKVGEIVGTEGLAGDFEIVSVNPRTKSVDIKLLGANHVQKSIPWVSLKKKSREDVNQAAFRIVREATKD